MPSTLIVDLSFIEAVFNYASNISFYQCALYLELDALLDCSLSID